MLDAQALADRYVAAWNEPDAARRSSAIAALWAPDALRQNEARGYGALSKLILGSPERTGMSGIRYRAARTARLRGDLLTFRWEMLLAESETALASGLEFLILDGEGRILADHPFADASPPVHQGEPPCPSSPRTTAPSSTGASLAPAPRSCS